MALEGQKGYVVWTRKTHTTNDVNVRCVVGCRHLLVQSEFYFAFLKTLTYSLLNVLFPNSETYSSYFS